MKKLLVTAIAACLMLGSATSFADRDDAKRWSQSRHDNGYHRGWDRGDRWDRRWDNRRRDRDHDHVSINLGFGNSWGYPYTGSYFGFGVGNYSSWHNRNRAPVVIYENNTYIERSAPRTTVITRSAPRSGTSMLRDVNGRCFERQYDRNGNETRIEVSPAECNF